MGSRTPREGPHHRVWFAGILVLLAAMLLVSITAAVMLGPVAIDPGTVWKIALSNLPGFAGKVDQTWSQGQSHIIWDIRFPRVLLGAVVGAGLSVAGVAAQALMRNSLADPYILGVSSGASVGATLVILLGAFSYFGQYALSLAAFMGALVAMGLVFLLARVAGRISTTRLLLSGIAISMMMSAATNFIVTMAPREEGIRTAMYWMMGSLAGAKWSYMTFPVLIVLAGTLLFLLQYRSLNALLMGDDTAVTLGVNIQHFRIVLILTLALLTGTLVSISGSIGFVGLMIPHIVRLLIGSDHRRVLPVSLFLGAIFIVWADVLARMALAPEELPIGIVTALCGGPFFIWLLRRSSYSFGGGQE
ncbi:MULTISPECIES: FecCD family ABC transporter permease [Paenibacillus]|uniref:ABC transporter permease n=1 Tax=Paenibacillus campinasensis TaxID=66347 RepID=A0A268F074_9BACL|nr:MULTISPECIES: iron ABC transporter permease [Paenibacillus]MUG65513.1 iron chelate uptake ABC transporter family permease subunit [Paenibacillus campinasensis]PAD78788.1 ABC transporter permease [Paenibacillus campinasensis]PAK53928.1 ABC transporter permease [Paenibacillus sp. 7541]